MFSDLMEKLEGVEKKFDGVSEKKELSKKCLELKRVRENYFFMFMYEKLDDDVKKELKSNCEFMKSYNYFNGDRKEGNKKIDFEGLSKLEVFEKYDLSIKNMEKKGYKLNEKDIYIKIEAGDN